MSQGLKVLRIPVNDIELAKVLYGKLLGVEPYVDESYYVGFRLPGVELGLDPNGHAKGMSVPIAYWEVDDIKGSLSALMGIGARVDQDVQDVGGGMLTASVTDPDGNVIGLAQSPSA
jgi:predicted enzyme related to lactoylglutathione lyase